MARTKQLHYSVGRRISDKDFGSMDFHVGETVELDEGDDRKREFAFMTKRVNREAGIIADNIQEAINANLKKKKRESR